MAPNQKFTACPSCGTTEVEVSGNQITCLACDAVFRINRQGAMVESVGRIAHLEQRVDALEGKRGLAVPEGRSAESETDEAETENEEARDENGFPWG